MFGIYVVIGVFAVLVGMGFSARFIVLEGGEACICNKGPYVDSHRDLRVVLDVCWR